MPIVKASENPIHINEEVLDEGLIDAIRQGANYLKDRHTVRKYNRLAKTINQSSNPSQFTNGEEYKIKQYDAREAQDRKDQFDKYIKYRTSKEGRAEEKARKALQTKLTGKEKQIMKLQDKIAENKKKTGYNEDTDPDIKRLQQLTGDISKNNPNAVKDSIENIRKYRNQQKEVPGAKKTQYGYLYNQGDERVNPYNKNFRDIADISNKSKVNLINQERQLKTASNSNTSTAK